MTRLSIVMVRTCFPGSAMLRMAPPGWSLIRNLWAKRAEAPILGTFYTCLMVFMTVCVVSKGVYGVWNPKTVTLTTALVQWLADCQI